MLRSQAYRPCLPLNFTTSCGSSLLVWRRRFRILAIETSCDDTAVAVLDLLPSASSQNLGVCKAKTVFNRRLTANNLEHGGIHPLRTLEAHQANLAPLLEAATANTKSTGLPDLIAVTRGPGNRTNLQCGLDTAKGLAVAWDRPLVGVHHMQAHALTPRLSFALAKSGRANKTLEIAPKFPFLSLLVSGGHTLLVKSTSVTEHSVLASTHDIALGDCLDKIARTVLPKHIIDNASSVGYAQHLESFVFGKSMGGLRGYEYTPPKNTASEREKSNQKNKYGWSIPAPLISSSAGQKTKAMEFSFSGIFSAASRVVAYGNTHNTPRSKPISIMESQELAKAAMTAAFEHLASRVCLFLDTEKEFASQMNTQYADLGLKHTPVTALALGGGVTANLYLRHVLRHYLQARGHNIDICVSKQSLCTDNALMIAWTAAEMTGAVHGDEHFQLSSKQRRENLTLRGLRKWSLDNLMTPEKEEERERQEEIMREERKQKTTSGSKEAEPIMDELKSDTANDDAVEQRVEAVSNAGLGQSSQLQGDFLRQSGQSSGSSEVRHVSSVEAPGSSSELENMLLSFQANPDIIPNVDLPPDPPASKMAFARRKKRQERRKRHLELKESHSTPSITPIPRLSRVRSSRMGVRSPVPAPPEKPTTLQNVSLDTLIIRKYGFKDNAGLTASLLRDKRVEYAQTQHLKSKTLADKASDDGEMDGQQPAKNEILKELIAATQSLPRRIRRSRTKTKQATKEAPGDPGKRMKDEDEWEWSPMIGS